MKRTNYIQHLTEQVRTKNSRHGLQKRELAWGEILNVGQDMTTQKVSSITNRGSQRQKRECAFALFPD